MSLSFVLAYPDGVHLTVFLRGGRTEFKWTDVQNSTHRENYLGHSLMAPVGRWQQGRDLNWYAKGDVDEEAERIRKEQEERQRVKDAEEEAMCRALGLPIPEKASNNANLVPLGNNKVAPEDSEMAGTKDPQGDTRHSRKHRHDRSRSPRRERRRDHSDNRGRDRERRHRRHRDYGERDQDRHNHRSHRHRSRSLDREHRRRRYNSRSRSPDRRRDDHQHRQRRTDRSYSPAERKRDPERRRDRDDRDRRH